MLSFGFSLLFHLKSIAPFVFFTTLLVYSGQRYYKMSFTDVLTNTPRIEWMRKHKKQVEFILAIALIGALFFGLPLLLKGTFTKIIIFLCSVISIFYVVKLGQRNLREIPGLKVFLITIVYFVIICILPFNSFLDIEIRWRPHYWIHFCFFVFQYLYILGITILFDIPDIKNDSVSLKTIPQRFGTSRTILISLVLISPLLLYLVLSTHYKIYVWLLLVSHVLFYFYLDKGNDKHFYLSFFGEGILGILGLYYCLI